MTQDKYKAEAAKAKAAYDVKYPPGSQPKRTPKTKKAKAAAAEGANGEEEKPKAKRAPSAYNIYVQERMPAFKKPGVRLVRQSSMLVRHLCTLSCASCHKQLCVRPRVTHLVICRFSLKRRMSAFKMPRVHLVRNSFMPRQTGTDLIL